MIAVANITSLYSSPYSPAMNSAASQRNVSKKLVHSTLKMVSIRQPHKLHNGYVALLLLVTNIGLEHNDSSMKLLNIGAEHNSRA
jgi:hypothetical protein